MRETSRSIGASRLSSANSRSSFQLKARQLLYAWTAAGLLSTVLRLASPKSHFETRASLNFPTLIIMIGALRQCTRRSLAATAGVAQAPLSYRSLSSSAVRLSAAVDSSSYTNIKVSDEAEGKVRLITLNRPKALNALNSALFHELNDATENADNDPNVGAIVITGSEKAFAAGAEIKEMAPMNFSSAYKNNFLGHWTKITTIRKPIIAAVSGYAVSSRGWHTLSVDCADL